MHKTHKYIEGMPSLAQSYDSIFAYPFCNKAKLTKGHNKNPSEREFFLPGTLFCMDVGFIHGPDNLTEVVCTRAAPGLSLIAGIDGSTMYLRIFDAAIKYIWVFPM